MHDIYKKIEEYNPNKKRRKLIIFDDMIADMISNKKLNPVVTESFIRNRKLNIYLVFIKNLILLCQKNQTKFYDLFYYEGFRQTKTSTNCI